MIIVSSTVRFDYSFIREQPKPGGLIVSVCISWSHPTILQNLLEGKIFAPVFCQYKMEIRSIRLMKEWKEIAVSPIRNINVSPLDESHLSEWSGNIFLANAI
jgi:hypothetical protein